MINTERILVVVNHLYAKRHLNGSVYLFIYFKRMNALAGDHIDVKTPLSEMTTLKRSSVNKKSKSEDTKVVLPVKHARKYLTW